MSRGRLRWQIIFKQLLIYLALQILKWNFLASCLHSITILIVLHYFWPSEINLLPKEYSLLIQDSWYAIQNVSFLVCYTQKIILHLKLILWWPNLWWAVHKFKTLYCWNIWNGIFDTFLKWVAGTDISVQTLIS